jgi:Sap, sulfolipid-1-addressing protein
MGDVFVFSLTAALNPTLLAASTLMMLLPNAKSLMFGYLLGALLTSITCGVVIVFALEGSSAVSTTKRTLSPAATLALGGIALVLAFVLGTGRARRPRERRQKKGPPRWQRALEQGSARITFVVGALLSLPGASYIAGLTRIHKLNYPTAPTVALIVAFNLVMLALLEVPLLGFVLAPDWTVNAIGRAKTWLAGHGQEVASRALAVIGVLLVIKGVVELVS